MDLKSNCEELIQLNIRKKNNPNNKWAKHLNRQFSKEDILRTCRHLTGCWTSLAIREMQNHKDTPPYTIQYGHHNQSTKNTYWWEWGKKGTLVYCWWESRLLQSLWKTVWNFLIKLKFELPFDPVIPLLGLYVKNPKSPVWKNLCTLMFIAAQFAIAKCWKQPKCPSVNEWIKTLWYIYTM